jgi:hypothetical protein
LWFFFLGLLALGRSLGWLVDGSSLDANAVALARELLTSPLLEMLLDPKQQL